MIVLYSKTWVNDHLAWATTLTWATVFSCTDAILVHFTLWPATTWQTRPVAYLELVIYLLNATIILLQNTKLTVKFTRDGRPYPHLTPHCRWPGRLPVATVHGWLMADRHHGEPNTLWPSDYCSPNCTCIILTCSHTFQSTRFALFNCYRMWQMAAVNQTFLRLQINAGNPCCTKECEVTPNWTKHTKTCLLPWQWNIFMLMLLSDLLLLLHDSHKKLISIINRPCARNHLRPTWSTSQILVLEI